MDKQLDTAIFAGGCFWCLEAIFARIKGVVHCEPGYCGGSREQASYRTVCSGNTGHAEAVRLRYDPTMISYPSLLQVFFAIHDPTTLNRQGHDMGTQYRSAIFYLDAQQQDQATAVMQQLAANQTFSQPLVTECTPAPAFYPAEAEHHRYFDNNQPAPYCQAVITPKIRAFLQQFGGICQD